MGIIVGMICLTVIILGELIYLFKSDNVDLERVISECNKQNDRED